MRGQLAFLCTSHGHEAGNHREQRLKICVHVPDSGGLENQVFGSRGQHQWREALDRRAWREHQTRTAKPETAAHDTRRTQLVFSTAIVSSAAPVENPMVARWPPVIACIGHHWCHWYYHSEKPHFNMGARCGQQQMVMCSHLHRKQMRVSTTHALPLMVWWQNRKAQIRLEL